MEMKEMEQKLAAMEHEIGRLQDKNEIEMLIGNWATMWCQKNMHRMSEFFDLEDPDCLIEASDGGILRGEAGIRKLFEEIYQIPDNHGSILAHHFSNYMIQVAGDRQTAKAAWWAISQQAIRDANNELTATWCFTRYAADFKKKNGEWKAWHVHFYTVNKCEYDKGWVKDYNRLTSHSHGSKDFAVANGFKGQNYDDLEISFFNPYSPQFIQVAVPAMPRPYETWGPGEEDWIFAEEPDMKGFIGKMDFDESCS